MGNQRREHEQHAVAPSTAPKASGPRPVGQSAGPLSRQGLLDLQPVLGNQRVARLASTVQRKLHVGRAGDRYEQEADRVADEVMRDLGRPQVIEDDRAAGRVQATPCPVQRLGTDELIGMDGGPLGDAAEQRIAADRGQGASLPDEVRRPMEQAFGSDLSPVRVHAGPGAAALARSVQARAFTVGSDIFFGAGQYRPATRDGQRLLAHELTHTIQQGSVRRFVDAQRARATATSQLFRSFSISTNAPTRIQRNFKEGDRVRHPEYGEGKIMEIDGPDCYLLWDTPGLFPKPGALKVSDPQLTLIDPAQGGTAPSSTQQAPTTSTSVTGQIGQSTGAPPVPGNDNHPGRDRFGNNVRKTEFESTLAAYLNNDARVMAAVRLASSNIQQILTILRMNVAAEIIATIKARIRPQTGLLGYHRPVAEAHGQAMGRFLYSTGGTFGSIGTAVPRMGAISEAIDALEGGYGNIQSMLLAQQAFLFNILLRIEAPLSEQVGDALDQLKPPESERGRTKDPGAQQGRGMHATLGITADYQKGSDLAGEVGAQNLLPHTRTQESTRPDESHPTTRAMRALDVPFVGGLSGSAADLITVAREVGGLNGEALQYYTLGVIGYLVGGGMHSIHEIMQVASRVGIPYRPGDYDSIFPDSFRATRTYQLLQATFPDLLPPPVSKWQGAKIRTPK